ncbi:MAG: glycoside hydrolase family 3 C-terminal domain-containing protein [Candidatus Lokiarchaeota archaeon]|nr:glycoside hydrolase family 3 C-terminal domain-containing protein [Candidatus Lokiarchaeota archaeon]
MVSVDEKLLYLDYNLPLEERIDDLISRLTLDEKIPQFLNNAIAIERLNLPKYDWWNEALHGIGFAGIATVFPQAIGLAASFDLELMSEVAKAISDEGRAKHHEAVRNDQRKIYQGLTFWSPNVNIFRDPRWGRGQETYGEDPYLTSQMGVTFIKGLQGDHPKYLKLVATPKHYVAYSGLEHERHFFDAKVSKKDLYETYLPAFEACIKEGKAEGIMGAYNRVNGEPCCASKFLLQDVLREKWKFKGHVVSDCGAIRDIFHDHKVVETGAEAAAMAINAGCDLFCSLGISLKKKKKIRWDWINNAIQEGLLTEDAIDKALKRLLRAKFLLGMFDPPEMVPYTKIPYEVNDSEAHRLLAINAARKTFVLLKNEENILPLKKDVKNLAVIGPTADNKDVLLGNYFGTPSRYTTILQGIKEKVTGNGEVFFAEGCPLKEKSEEGFGEAIRIAKEADIVIMVLGISPRLEGEQGQAFESDLFGDRIDIGLPGSQNSLLKEIHEIGKPIVLILTGGSALSFEYAKEKIPAILFAWYPGEEGGKAVADVVFGDYNPAGRLPVTFYKNNDQIPDIRDYSMKGRTYRYFYGEPLYPFGFGLSYTNFHYENLDISTDKVKIGENVNISVEIENIGNISGEEVVQLYLSHSSPKYIVPIRELKGFRKLVLNKNEKKNVKFTLTPHDYSTVNMEGNRIVDPGEIMITIGGSQPEFRENNGNFVHGTIELIGKSLIFE